MNDTQVDRIVKAVLYEGYMLYPYHPSSIKNRQRFNFGVIYPREYSEQQRGNDSWVMQTECLALGNSETQCAIRVRFLRMVSRTVGKVRVPATELSSLTEADIEHGGTLEVEGKIYQPWQEVVEETIELPDCNLSALVSQPIQWPIRMAAKCESEPVRDEQSSIVGVIERRKAEMAGMIEATAKQIHSGLFKLITRITNDSRLDCIDPIDREVALMRSLVSAHTILDIRNGEFVSLIDPPESYREFVPSCQNVGTWPVLVGEQGQRDTILSSPIILYDYPEIALESPGDLFDGAEIDEILSLRIMTLTDEEKQEMRQSDERTRAILERTETLPDEQLNKLHGVLRGMRNVREETR